jgi:endonuclease III
VFERRPSSRKAPELKQRAAEVFPEIHRRLQDTYHSASLGNKKNPLDELIYIQLSIRTREGAYQSIYSSLRRAVGGMWGRLLTVPDEMLLPALEPGGMARVKLERLRGIVATIKARFGRVTLAPLHRMSDTDAETFLLTLPGVGPKAARCVMMYSLGRQVFPVDSHCLRVLRRLGLVPPNIDRKKAHNQVQELVPPSLRHRLHVNLIHHGREVCVSGRPRCSICPLLSICPTGQELFSHYPATSLRK